MPTAPDGSIPPVHRGSDRRLRAARFLSVPLRAERVRPRQDSLPGRPGEVRSVLTRKRRSRRRSTRSSAGSSSISSNATVSRTGPRWGRSAFRPAATGGCPATPIPTPFATELAPSSIGGLIGGKRNLALTLQVRDQLQDLSFLQGGERPLGHHRDRRDLTRFDLGFRDDNRLLAVRDPQPQLALIFGGRNAGSKRGRRRSGRCASCSHPG